MTAKSVTTKIGKYTFDRNGLISKELLPDYEKRIKEFFDGITNQTDLVRIGAYDVTGFPAIGEDGQPNLIDGRQFSGWSFQDEDMELDAMFTVMDDGSVLDVLVTALPGFVVYHRGHEDDDEFKAYVKDVESSAIWSEYNS